MSDNDIDQLLSITMDDSLNNIEFDETLFDLVDESVIVPSLSPDTVMSIENNLSVDPSIVDTGVGFDFSFDEMTGL